MCSRSCRSACREKSARPRFKEVAHPAPGVWMHHLELRDRSQVDAVVRGWLAAAYESAR